MAYSNQVAVSDGTLQTIVLSISFFDKSEISVYKDSVLQVVDVDYIWATSNSIQFPVAQVAGVEVRIDRTTDISAMRHIFSAGAQFTNQTLDEDYTQILHIVQEAIEGGFLTDLFNDLNMHGNRITNLGDPEAPGDAMSLQAVQAEILDGELAKRSVRAPTFEGPINALPAIADRKDRLISFDSAGNPIAVAPVGGSATELAMFLANDADPAKGAALIGFKGRTQAEVNDDMVSVKSFGAVGNYVTDDTAAIIAADAWCYANGKVLYFPEGVYKCTNGIAASADWWGKRAPQMRPFPLTGDDKQYLRPGYKHLIPGACLLFTGTGTATATTQRSDQYASFTYMVKTARTGRLMQGVGLILDCDVYDAGGALTALGFENSAAYDVGHYIDDVPQCTTIDVTVFGYLPKAGSVVRSVLGNDDPDYNQFRGGTTMGKHGLALIGSETNDGFSSGLSGTQTWGLDVFTLDHHSRSVGTAAAIYANADTWRLVYIDGFTTASTTRINGHYLHGGSMRTYAIHPVELDCASQPVFESVIFESSNFAGVPNAATKSYLASSQSFDPSFITCRFATDVGLLAPAFGGTCAGQLSIINCAGLAHGNGILISEANGGVAQWIKMGGASGGSGDPAIQWGNGSALSSVNGWSLRRDISASDVLQLRWNGTSVFTCSTSGPTTFNKVIGQSTRSAANSPAVMLHPTDTTSGFNSTAADLVGVTNVGVQSTWWDTDHHQRPGADNVYQLGSASFRYSTAFFGTAPTVTSDARFKTPIRTLQEAELEAGRKLVRAIGVYQWAASVEEKGVDAARLHVGQTVQHAKTILEECGLVAERYGFIMYDEWPDRFDDEGNLMFAAGSLYGFREGPMQSLMLAALAADYDALRLRVEALETI